MSVSAGDRPILKIVTSVENGWPITGSNGGGLIFGRPLGRARHELTILEKDRFRQSEKKQPTGLP
jgi:hypothetical protein